MTHYEQECRRVCKWCAKGSRVELRGPTGRTHQDAKCSSRYREPCLAPTESEFAERMAQEVERLREALQKWMQAASRAGFVFSIGKDGYAVEHDPKLAGTLAATGPSQKLTFD